MKRLNAAAVWYIGIVMACGFITFYSSRDVTRFLVGGFAAGAIVVDSESG